MFCFFFQKTFRNKEWEIGVSSAGFLDPSIQIFLNLFPNGIAIGPNHHTPFNRAIIRQAGLNHDVLIPLRKILGTGSDFFCHSQSVLCRTTQTALSISLYTIRLNFPMKMTSFNP